jgi:hypothetical protein
MFDAVPTTYFCAIHSADEARNPVPPFQPPVRAARCRGGLVRRAAGGAGDHPPTTSAIGLATAVSLGSETASGKLDAITRFLERIDSGHEARALTDGGRPR